MYDVTIVGGGPAGLSAALVLGRCRRRVIVFDEGRPRNAAARKLNGYLGRDGINPRQFMWNARVEVGGYGVEFTKSRVVQAESLCDPADSHEHTSFQVVAADGQIIQSRKILFATGVTDDLPDIPGIQECYGLSVHHCPYCDGWEHRDQSLLAIGASTESAANLALQLRRWTDKVTLLSNGAAIDEEEFRRLSQHGIAIYEQRIVELTHRDGRLSGALLEGGVHAPAEGLFFSTGHHARTDLPASLGCEFESDAVAKTVGKQHTTVPGVFFAGDADGDVQFVIVAAGEGARAAVAINKELHEEDCRIEEQRQTPLAAVNSAH